MLRTNMLDSWTMLYSQLGELSSGALTPLVGHLTPVGVSSSIRVRPASVPMIYDTSVLHSDVQYKIVYDTAAAVCTGL